MRTFGRNGHSGNGDTPVNYHGNFRMILSLTVLLKKVDVSTYGCVCQNSDYCIYHFEMNGV
uniref:Uncharacterized protein n=1 Tax=Romanomermis culicivorax TaxID=13658 RepID=A0A915HYR7_ROMCU